MRIGVGAACFVLSLSCARATLQLSHRHRHHHHHRERSAENSDSPVGEVWRAEFSVQLGDNSTGNFTVEVHPDWAPRGAARFRELVDQRFFSDVRFFRVVKHFIAQFGIAGDPVVASEWRSAKLEDDTVAVSNKRGYMSFATSGPNTRTT